MFSWAAINAYVPIIFAGSCLSPDLNMGVITLSHQLCGKNALVRIWFNSLHMADFK